MNEIIRIGERPSGPPDKFVLGIDVGGQSIKCAAYLVEDGKISEFGFDFIEDTQKGAHTHVAQVANIIKNMHDSIKKSGGEVVGVGVASPGRFDSEGRIKPGTNPNIGKTPDEMDNVNLQNSYEAALKYREVDVPLVVANDGNAMLAGMIDSLKKRGLSLNNRQVAMFGIGTGLGHAIAKFDQDGGYKFVTDGHASKLKIQIDEQDWDRFKAAADKLQKRNAVTPSGGVSPVHICDEENRIVRAEDVCRDPLIKAMAGVSDGRDMDDLGHDPGGNKRAALEFSGKYLGRLIGAIASGQSEDIVPEQGWSEVDKQVASKTTHYVIGGGMARGEAGAVLVEEAEKELHHQQRDNIRLLQFVEPNVAEQAAANMALATLEHDKGVSKGAAR